MRYDVTGGQLQAITDLVAVSAGTTAKRLRSHDRTAAASCPRHMAFFIAYRATNKTLAEIGRYFNGRDHATVREGILTHTRRESGDPDIRRQREEIERELEGLYAPPMFIRHRAPEGLRR